MGIDRKRDLSNLTKEQESALQAKLTEKLTEILAKAEQTAKNEANQLLNQYGMQVNVKVGFTLKEQKIPKSKKSAKS